MQSYRFAFAALGGIIVSVVALPLTKILGAGDLQKGYFLAMVIMGSMSTIMFFLCFALTKEHYVKEVDKSHNLRGIYQELLIIIKDFNWCCIFSLNIASLIAGILKTGGAIYFVSYYMKRPDLVSTVLVIILCTRFVGAMSTTLLYKNFDRVRAYKLTLVIQAVILTALLPSRRNLSC